MDNKIKVIKLDDKATIPMYGDASPIIYFYALEGFRLKRNLTTLVKTGIKIKIPSGYILEIAPLNSMSLYNGITMPNSPYYITESYDEEVMIPLCYNTLQIDGSFSIDLFGDLKLDNYGGKPIAKGILKKVERPEIVEVNMKEFNTTYIYS